MNLINATKLVAGYTMATDKTGREWLVVVAKGTYRIPDDPEREPPLQHKQVPLTMTDLFSGDPGSSAPLCECDFAPSKARCDVLLNGSCYAPAGKLATVVPVGMRVGTLTKSFNVVGNRVWKSSTLGITASLPEPFTVLPLSYNNAYGGVDMPNDDPKTHQWYLLNHVGVGYHPKSSVKTLVGKPLPNTEEIGNAVLRPDGNYKPMAFGPVGRAWRQRIRWAGTYDQKWLDHQFPFLPEDFDSRYFQAAAEDQQIPYPSGGEEVVLIHLTPQRRTAFRLPTDLGLPVVFCSREGGMSELPAVVDTVLLEPDEGRFVLVWRASMPLRRNIRDVLQVKLGQSIHQALLDKAREERMRGKQRFKSLAELAAWSRVKRRSGGPDYEEK